LGASLFFTLNIVKKWFKERKKQAKKKFTSFSARICKKAAQISLFTKERKKNREISQI